MTSGEDIFDDLIRQKFDETEFAFNEQSWNKMEQDISASEQGRFDDIVREKFNEKEFVFNEENWEVMEGKIISARKFSRNSLWAAIFVIGLITGVSVMFLVTNQSSENNTIAENSTSSNNSSATTSNNNNSISNNTSNNQNESSNGANENSNDNAIANNSNDNSNAENTSENTSSSSITEIADNTNSSAVENNNSSSKKIKTENNNIAISNNSTSSKSTKQENTNTSNNKTNSTISGNNKKVSQLTFSNKGNIATTSPTKSIDNTNTSVKQDVNSANNNTADNNQTNTTKTDAGVVDNKQSENKDNNNSVTNNNTNPNSTSNTNTAVESKNEITLTVGAKVMNADGTPVDSATLAKAIKADSKEEVKEEVEEEIVTKEDLKTDKKAKSSSSNTPGLTSATYITADAGAGYSLGWKYPGAKEANGFNPIGGLGITHYFNPKWALNAGVQYGSIYNLKASTKTFSSKDYGFGSTTTDTTINTKKLHYITVPVLAQYNFNNSNSILFGASAAYLMNANSSISISTSSVGPPPSGFDTSSVSTQNSVNGYYKGAFNQFDASLAVGYRRKITQRFSMTAIANFGLLDVKKNDFFGIDKTERNSSVKLILTYNLFEF